MGSVASGQRPCQCFDPWNPPRIVDSTVSRASLITSWVVAGRCRDVSTCRRGASCSSTYGRCTLRVCSHVGRETSKNAVPLSSLFGLAWYWLTRTRPRPHRVYALLRLAYRMVVYRAFCHATSRVDLCEIFYESDLVMARMHRTIASEELEPPLRAQRRQQPAV